MALIVRPKLAQIDVLPRVRDNKINAYCKFAYEKNHLVSKVHHNSGNHPDWSDELTFNNYNSNGIMWVEVMHQQAPHDILLGTGSIIIKQLKLQPHSRKPYQITLMSAGPQQSKTGTVTISIQYVPSDIDMHIQINTPIALQEKIPSSEIIQNIQIPIHQSISQIKLYHQPKNMEVSVTASNDHKITTSVNPSITDSRIFYQKTHTQSRENSREQKSNKKISNEPNKLPPNIIPPMSKEINQLNNIAMMNGPSNQNQNQQNYKNNQYQPSLNQPPQPNMQQQYGGQSNQFNRFANQSQVMGMNPQAMKNQNQASQFNQQLQQQILVLQQQIQVIQQTIQMQQLQQQQYQMQNQYQQYQQSQLIIQQQQQQLLQLQQSLQQLQQQQLQNQQLQYIQQSQYYQSQQLAQQQSQQQVQQQAQQQAQQMQQGYGLSSIVQQPQVSLTQQGYEVYDYGQRSGYQMYPSSYGMTHQLQNQWGM